MNPDPMLERILADKRSMTTTQVAKGYGMSARKLNALLEQAGIQEGQRELGTLYSTFEARSRHDQRISVHAP